MITGAQLSTAAAAGSVVQGDLCKNQCEHKNTHNLVKDTKTLGKTILKIVLVMQLLPFSDTHIRRRTNSRDTLTDTTPGCQSTEGRLELQKH